VDSTVVSKAPLKLDFCVDPDILTPGVGGAGLGVDTPNNGSLVGARVGGDLQPTSTDALDVLHMVERIPI